MITAQGTYVYALITPDEARSLLEEGDFISTIGYQETANALEVLCGVSVPVNRIQIKMKLKNGYSKGAKAGRTVGHLVADVFTCGLWEVVGTPTEIAFDGKDCTAKVFYNENNCVNRVVITEQ